VDIKVTLYRNKCIACSYCVSLAPDLWILSSTDGKVTPLSKSSCQSEQQNLVLDITYKTIIEQSVKLCPVKVFKLN
jgi:ferredoxin